MQEQDFLSQLYIGWFELASRQLYRTSIAKVGYAKYGGIEFRPAPGRQRFVVGGGLQRGDGLFVGCIVTGMGHTDSPSVIRRRSPPPASMNRLSAERLDV